MIRGDRVLLRRIRDADWPQIEAWAENPDALWGPFQRFQLDAVHALREAFDKTGLLSRESALLLIETVAGGKAVGIVRYTLQHMADPEIPVPEVGFVIADSSSRGKGYAREAVELLLGYIFARVPAERVSSFTDVANMPARKLLESLGFQLEGTIRRAMFRGASWTDVAMYGIIRDEWQGRDGPPPN